MADVAFRIRRGWKYVHRRARECMMLWKGIKSMEHPVQVHIIPMRRCNLSCTYCNEYDDHSKPVPLEVMKQRLDKLAALKTTTPKDQSVFPAGLAAAVYVIFLIMFLAPKLIGFLDVTMRPGEIARYGGRWRFAAGCVVEIVFSFLLSAVTTFRTSVFVFELILGRSVLWSGQARDTGALAFKDACREFWPQSISALRSSRSSHIRKRRSLGGRCRSLRDMFSRYLSL